LENVDYFTLKTFWDKTLVARKREVLSAMLEWSDIDKHENFVYRFLAILRENTDMIADCVRCTSFTHFQVSSEKLIGI
jgi:hypothetical protein